MTPIARCNNVVLLESGRVSRLVDQGGSWLATARYVMALIAIIIGLNGLGNRTMPFDTRIVMLTIAGLCGAAAAWIHGQIRAHAKDSKSGSTIVTFDFGAGQVRDAAGRALAPIADVRLERTWQLTSSSRALSLRHVSSGRIILARGNPFGDSVDALEDALVARGIQRDGAF